MTRSKLRDALQRHITEVGRHGERAIDEYGVYSERGALRSGIQTLRDGIPWNDLSVDVVAALGRSGIPLAAGLVLDPTCPVESWCVISDPDVAFGGIALDHIRPALDLTDTRILLLDSVIRTGNTALDGARKVRASRGTVAGVAALVDYPDLPLRRGVRQLSAEFGVEAMTPFLFRPHADIANWIQENPGFRFARADKAS